jgi:hypothetical protein
LSKARVLLGEQVMRRIFEIDAARADAEPGIGAAWHGIETTAIDGATIELFNNDELAEAFGVPAGGTKSKIRIAAHVRTGSRRWMAAAIGGYLDGENMLADELESSFTARRPCRRHRRPRPGPHPVHRRAVPAPRPRHRRRLPPALR